MPTKKQSDFSWYIKRFGFKNNVKFTDATGKVYYGEIQDPTLTFGSYYKEAVAAAKKGLAFIVDAVTPQSYVFPHEHVVLIEQGPYTRGGDRNKFTPLHDDEWHKYQADEANKAVEASNAAAGQPVAGAMFAVGVADGKAFYVISQVKGSQCLVEHRKFGGDGYYDHHFGAGGWFSKRQIATYVHRHYGLSQLFKAK